MSTGLAFWILMLLWFILGLVTNWPGGGVAWPYGGVVSNLVLFILFLLLGWSVFGAPLK